MSQTPDLLAKGRGRRLAALAAVGLAQAAAAAAAAWATRSLFLRWHDGLDPTPALTGLAAAAAALALLRIIERTAAEDLGQRYAAAVRQAVFAHLSRLPLPTVEKWRTGGLMLRFTGDLSALSGWASRGVARLAVSGVALPLTLAALAWLSPAGALGASIPLALGALAMVLAGAPLGVRHRSLRRRRARLASDMGERLRLAPVLRLIGRMQFEADRLDKAAFQLRDAAVTRARRRAMVRAASDLAGGLAAVGVALACWRTGSSAAELAGALAALALALDHLRALGDVWDRRHAAAAARQRLDALFATPRIALPARRRAVADAPALRFEAVEAGPLNGFDATLLQGEKVALEGSVGAGKTTLLRLAAGLTVPSAGRVTVCGIDPLAFAARERARLILHLAPETWLLSGSLRRALTLGMRERPDDAMLIAMAERVGLETVLARLGGLDGLVSEGARTLSDGERGLIGLARLVLRPDALALIDGIDAHLDGHGRAMLAQTLASRPGAALVAPRHDDIAAACCGRWALAGVAPAYVAEGH